MSEDQVELFSKSVGPEKSRHVYRVSEITQDIKLILESTFGEIWVEGEVSNFNAYPSGHFYFSLKDDQAVLAAVMFSRANRDLKFKIENGIKAICFGKISAYGPRGQYQLIVERVEPKGVGSLQLALEQLKEKLEKEGLFAPGHKRPIPYLPARIGVVTSLAGAAIRDILKVWDRRFSGVHVIISPAQVQGETAKIEIAQAIKDLNTFNSQLSSGQKIEVLIVGRGGGSSEDLWAFNEEVVARAIYHSQIPVISAVGHERDWTIADLVADLRAPTPSVAAELVMPQKEDLQERIRDQAHSLKTALLDIVSLLEDTVDQWGHRLDLTAGHILELSISEFRTAVNKLALLNPRSLVQQHSLRVGELAKQVYLNTQHFLQLKQAGFTKFAEQLSSLSPLNILLRGYSITFKMPEERVVKEAQAVKLGDTLKTKLHQGEIISRVMHKS